MFNAIKTSQDIKKFYDETNALHDGYIMDVHYTNRGISQVDNGHHFDFAQTKLILQILVTSICDTMVEIESENLSEWQIKDNYWNITDTTVMFDEQHRIVWSDEVYIDMDEVRKGSYAIAKSMKWRIVD